MTDRVVTAKRALRAELRERRALRTDADRVEAAAGIKTQLDALVARYDARTVSCFVATPSEPGTAPFIADAVRRGIRVLLPVSRSDGLLDWAVAEADGRLVDGPWGISEPTGELLSPFAVGEADLMIIPAAAVDLTGMRLGWGRGYFDKTLGSMQHPPPVYAVIFDTELIRELPSEVHDRRVDGVVTPTQTLDLAPQLRHR